MEQFGINFKVLNAGLISTLKDVSSRLGGVNSAVNTTYGGWYNHQKKVNQAQVNLNRDLNRSSKLMKDFGKTFSGIKFALGIGSVYGFGQALTSSVNSALAMIETENLFNVSLGETRAIANETIVSLSNLYGLDQTNLKNSVGTYAMLARSMGMTSSQANVLATNTSQLAIDLASLTNVPIQQVMADLRSGLVGQSETVYKYGIDVTEAGIKQEAMRQGITKSVRNMSQGEKMALRYAVMIRQTGLAHGDFARTINTPANQLKILGERFTTLSRTIGTIFLPILGQILPYANAVVLALTEIAQAIAQFVGYGKKTGDDFAKGWNDIKRAESDALNDTTANANDASESIDGIGKAIKNATSGMDELNVLSQTTAGIGDIDGGSILDQIEIPTLQPITPPIDDFVKQLKDKLKPELERILILIAAISGGLLLWRVGNFIAGLVGIVKYLLTILGILKSPIVSPTAPKTSYGSYGLNEQRLANAIYGRFAPDMKTIIRLLGGQTASRFLKSVGDVAKKLLGGPATAGALGAGGKMFLPAGGKMLLPAGAGKDLVPASQEILKTGGGIAQILSKFAGLAFVLSGIWKLFDGIKGILEEAEFSWGNFGKALSGVALVAGGLFLLLGGWFPALIGAIVSGIAVASAYIYKNWDTIKAFTIEKWNAIKKFFVDTWSNISSYVKEKLPLIIDAIVTFFSNLPYNLGFALGTVIKTVKDWFVNLWNTVVTETPLLIERIKLFWDELPTKIYNAILNFRTKFIIWFFNIGELAKTEYNKFSKKFADFFLNLPTKISETLESIKQKFKDIGSSILDGIISGMSGIGKKLKGWSDSFIRGIKDALDINSPSKVAEDEIGWNFGLGVLKGLEKTAPLISDSAYAISDQVKSAFDGANSFGVTGAYTANTKTVASADSEFVASIYDAVSRAVTNIDLSGQVVENVLNLDGEVIYRNQQKIATGRGTSFGMGVFAR